MVARAHLVEGIGQGVDGGGKGLAPNVECGSGISGADWVGEVGEWAKHVAQQVGVGELGDAVTGPRLVPRYVVIGVNP